MPAGIQSLRPYLKVVDTILEVADARLPATSRYPDLGKILAGKAVILVLSRADLADPAATARWLEYYRTAGQAAIALNARDGEGLRALRQQLRQIARGKRERQAGKGIGAGPLRVMALGLPNVGKSSLLNRLAGRGAARTGDRPGVTRGPQWIRLAGDLELLDTPGALWPSWRERAKALWLAALGCLPEGEFPVIEMASLVGEFLLARAPGNLAARYGITPAGLTGPGLLEAIGRRRGYLLPGGRVDQEKTALALVKDFREGYLGRYTLEMP